MLSEVGFNIIKMERAGVGVNWNRLSTDNGVAQNNRRRYLLLFYFLSVG